MTYLKGETTWVNLLTKLADLATGTVADDYGVTCAPEHRWRRPVAGIASSTNEFLAPPASTDKVVKQEHRAGYWTRVDDNFSTNAPDPTQWMRQVAGWSAWHTSFGTNLNVFVMARISVANTVAGNYQGAQVILKSLRSDGGTGLTSQTTLTLDSSGTATWTVAAGYTMTIQCGSPSGLLTAGAFFQRVFTSTYRGGIDYWRHFGKHTNPTTRPFTWTTPLPSGVDGTDYEGTGAFFHKGSFYTSSANYWEVQQQYSAWPSTSSNNGYFADRWQPSMGLGHKTNVGLTGERYEVQFSYNDMIGQFTRSTSSGTITFQQGGTGVDQAGLRTYAADGWYDAKTFLDPYTATTQPADTSRIQYWMTVQDGHLAVVLNADPAATGTLTANMFAKVESELTAQGDTGCWFMGNIGATYSGRQWYRLGAHSMFERYSVKGVEDGGRDWQTGQGRIDVFSYNAFAQAQWGYGAFGVQPVAMAVEQLAVINNWGPSNSSPYLPSVPFSTIRDATKHKMADWKMTGYYLGDASDYGESYGSAAGRWVPRGYVTRGLLMTPTGNYASGDELTDPTTGKKYTLFNSVNAYTLISAGGIAMEQV